MHAQMDIEQRLPLTDVCLQLSAITRKRTEITHAACLHGILKETNKKLIDAQKNIWHAEIDIGQRFY